MTQTALPGAVVTAAAPLNNQALAQDVANVLRNPVQAAIERIEKGMEARSAGGTFPYANNVGDVTQQTVNLTQQAMADVQRSGVTTATGFIGYDLKAPAATLVPFQTPLLNMTPRTPGVGIDTHHWKAITDFFGGNGPQSVIGAVADGGTPQFVSRTVVPMSNTFQTIGLQDSLTFQTQWRGRSFEGDLRALLTSQLLYALKLVEENWLINMSDYLWTPPPPLVTTAITGGSLASTNPYWFAITSVNAQGETLSTGILGPFTIASGSTGSIALTLFTVPNSTKYNVYAATAASKPAASAMWLQSAASNFGGASALNQPANPITGNFTATLTSLTTSGTALSTVSANTAKVAVDGSGNVITFQGSQALIYNNFAAPVGTGAGGLKSQIIQPAATTGYLALSDIQTLFLNMYNNARAVPECLFISPMDGISLNSLVASDGQTRVVVDGSTPTGGQASLTAGFKVTKILNQVTQTLVNVIQLPFLAQGTMIVGSFSFPYPVAGFPTQPFQVVENQSYYGVEYPPTPATPTSWGMGDFVDETLVNYFLGGWGIISGIVFH